MTGTYLPEHAEYRQHKWLYALTALILLATTLVATPFAGSVGAEDADAVQEDEALRPLPPRPGPPLIVHKELLADDGDGDDSVGDTLHFGVRAVNTRRFPAPIVVRDITTGDVEACRRVAPGEACTLKVAVKVTKQDIHAGYLTNEAQACTIARRAPGVRDEDVVAETLDVAALRARPGIYCDTATATKRWYPKLAFDKSADIVDRNRSGHIDAGDVIAYELHATNVGNVDLYRVEVHDDLIRLRCDRPQPARLAPGESINCAGRYVIGKKDIGQWVENWAWAGNKQVGKVEDHTRTYIPHSAAIAIKKVAYGKAGTFGFSGDLGRFALRPEADGFDYTVRQVNVGRTYSVTERVPAGWALDQLTCFGKNTNGDWAVRGATARITPDANELITCAWVNSPTKYDPPKDTTKDVPKTEDTTKDVPKTEDTTKDVPKTEDTTKDVPKTEDTTKDVPKTEDTTKDVPKTEDTTKDVPKAEIPKEQPKPQPKATLTIQKYAHGGSGTFHFGGSTGPFSIYGSEGSYVGTSFVLGAGAHSVSEGYHEGWYLYSIKCSGSGKWSADVGGATVYTDLSDGDHLTCVFVNKPVQKPEPEKEPAPTKVVETEAEGKAATEEDINGQVKVVEADA